MPPTSDPVDDLRAARTALTHVDLDGLPDTAIAAVHDITTSLDKLACIHDALAELRTQPTVGTDVVALVFGVSRPTITDRCRTGKIPCVKVGARSTRIPSAWVLRQLHLDAE